MSEIMKATKEFEGVFFQKTIVLFFITNKIICSACSFFVMQEQRFCDSSTHTSNTLDAMFLIGQFNECRTLFLSSQTEVHILKCKLTT